jgi:hypothetical protein
MSANKYNPMHMLEDDSENIAREKRDKKISDLQKQLVRNGERLTFDAHGQFTINGKTQYFVITSFDANADLSRDVYPGLIMQGPVKIRLEGILIEDET